MARKGEVVRSWLGVREGLLKVRSVFRSGKVVMFSGIPAGSWVGEGSVLKREPRRYEIVAMRASRVVHVPRATFTWLLETSFEFNHFVLRQLNERLSQYIGMVATDRVTDSTARLAGVLSTHLNPVLHPDTGLLIRLSQEELGELAGLSRQRVNVALRHLEEAGLVRVEYGAVLIREPQGLLQYSDTFS